MRLNNSETPFFLKEYFSALKPILEEKRIDGKCNDSSFSFSGIWRLNLIVEIYRTAMSAHDFQLGPSGPNSAEVSFDYFSIGGEAKVRLCCV